MKHNKEIIKKLRNELTELIKNKADYDEILKKSQELDKYIFDEFVDINDLN